MRNRPVPGNRIEGRKALIIGSGIAGLAAAFYLMRDGNMAGRDITILDAMQIEGGWLDGAGNPDDGYIIRGGREMNWNYDNLWDMFQDVQALELPEGYSVLDEYRMVNDNDPNFSKARLMHKRGEIRDFSTLGLNRSQQWELIRLLLKRKEDLDDITIEQYFSPGFLETNFWYLWRSMFAFENWQSLLEMKLYMHRFLDAIDGLNDMSALIFPKYNQYDSFVRPLVRHLQERGVQVRFGVRAYDFDMAVEGDRHIVKAIRAKVDGKDEVIGVGPNDVVFALTGSMTEGTAYGDMDTAPVLQRGRHEPGEGSDWTLWKNLAKKSPIFGKPEKFYGDTEKSMWESVTLTCKPSPFVDRLKQLSVNDPYSGKTVTGGIITFTDSNWVLSFTCNRQPHFPDQPKDVLVVWVYALLMDKDGNYVKKPMPACTGREIIAESLSSSGDRGPARCGCRKHQGPSGPDALYHCDVHAACRRRPAACRSEGMHQSGADGAVRRDVERHHLHHGQFDPHGTRRRVHTAGPAQAGPGYQPGPVRYPNAAQGRTGAQQR